MPTAVVCPNCRTRFEIASELAADEPIRCAKCMHTFLRTDSAAAGFQAGPAPITVTPIDDDDERERPSRPPRRPIPPPMFPMATLLWLAIGILFLLLVISVGFNAWVMLGGPDRRFRFEDQMRAEQDAMRARDMAQQAAEMARQQELQSLFKVEQSKKQLEESMRQLRLTEEQLEEARRQLKKDPEKQVRIRMPGKDAALMARHERQVIDPRQSLRSWWGLG